MSRVRSSQSGCTVPPVTHRERNGNKRSTSPRKRGALTPRRGREAAPLDRLQGKHFIAFYHWYRTQDRYRNDISTPLAIHKGHWIIRILRTLTRTIPHGRHSSFQFSFCTLNTQRRMSLFILWRIQLSTLIFLRCSRHGRLRRPGMKNRSTRRVTWSCMP